MDGVGGGGADAAGVAPMGLAQEKAADAKKTDEKVVVTGTPVNPEKAGGRGGGGLDHRGDGDGGRADDCV